MFAHLHGIPVEELLAAGAAGGGGLAWFALRARVARWLGRGGATR